MTSRYEGVGAKHYVTTVNLPVYYLDLDKLTLIWWFDFRLKPIYPTAETLIASKVTQNNHLASFSLIHTLHNRNKSNQNTRDVKLRGRQHFPFNL